MAILKAGYISVADADIILADSSEWMGSTTERKELAISWGRIYIDTNYSCVIDETAPSDSVQYANALFADQYVKGSLYSSQGERADSKTTVSETTKAGSVEVSETYAVNNASGNVVQSDPFPDISAILYQDGCSYRPAGNGGSFKTVPFVRGR